MSAGNASWQPQIHHTTSYHQPTQSPKRFGTKPVVLDTYLHAQPGEPRPVDWFRKPPYMPKADFWTSTQPSPASSSLHKTAVAIEKPRYGWFHLIRSSQTLASIDGHGNRRMMDVTLAMQAFQSKLVDQACIMWRFPLVELILQRQHSLIQRNRLVGGQEWYAFLTLGYMHGAGAIVVTAAIIDRRGAFAQKHCNNSV
ncbi:unnamed protein product [Periconia digitata]|uniref:Uncharacterized protein n=1 Tax=Periconia digitata TaxID=1303443 RepID=A0A9W4U9A8_9PLEO|nr:unnamed protein product [Periconia digitata]